MHRLISLLGIELNPVSYREKFVSMLGGIVAIFALIFLTGHLVGLSGASAVIASIHLSRALAQRSSRK